VPIIALTADVTTVDLTKCKAVGMDDYIAKPVDERVLYNKMVTFLKKAPIKKAPKKSKVSKILKNKYTNLKFLKERTKSNKALMMEMISLYLEQTPPLIKNMRQSLTNKDWQSLHTTVHKIIPSFSIMGISIDYENMARKIQEYASNQEHTEEISDLVTQLEKVCLLACDELKTELNAIKNNTHGY